MKHYGRWTIALIITIFIFSCGRSSDTPVGQADSGGIAPKVQWDYRNKPDIEVAAGFKPLTEDDSSVKGKPASDGNGDNLLHKAPLGVYKVRATILDTSNNPVPGFQTTKDVAPGDSGYITFTSVPAGTYNVQLEGLDSTGSDVLYTGQTNGIGVTANQVAEPSIIARYTRSDNASPGSSNKSPSDGATNIPANTKISVQVSDNDAGVDAESIVLTINNENVTSKSSIIGTSDNYTVQYTPSSNLSGTVTVTLRASDLANPANSMTTETWSFTISSSGTTDTTAPSSPSISFGSITETSSQLVTPTISASDDTGVTGYYLSESSTTPSSTSSGWTSITSTTSYNANVQFTLSSGNGSKTVNVWFKDAVGNISSSSSATITFNQTDTTAPTSPSVSINSGATSTTTASVTLTLSASDNTGVTGYYASESSITPSLTATNWVSVTSTTSYSASVSFTLSSSLGTKTVYVWFRDAAGNISASANSSITYTYTASSDGTNPTNQSVSINSGATSTTSTSITLSLSATDDVGVTGYCAKESSTTPSSSDTCWTSVTSTTSYSASVSWTLSSGTGIKTVYVWFRDAAGNRSGSAIGGITLNATDTTAPSGTTVVINSGDTYTATTAVTLILGASDNGGVTGYCAKESSTTPSVSDTCWTSVTLVSGNATVSFTLSSGSGTKTVYVWFRDAAGNVSAAANDSITSTLDTTAPSSPAVSINSGGASTTSTSVTLTLSATDSVGVTGYYTSETSTTPSASATGWTSVTSATSYSGSVSFTLSSGNGTKTVYVWFRDAAGNVSSAASDSITLTVNTWSSVSGREGHTIAIKTDGTIWTWGYNYSGELGDGTTTNKTTPTQIGTSTTWSSVSAGYYHTIAIKTDGTLWAWGNNSYGQLGDGTTTQRNSPIQIGTATNWSSVSTGFGHTIAIKTDGTIWAWGQNVYGQLGDGTTTNKTTPTQIGTSTTWSSISAGYGYTMAIKTDGTLWAWGYNLTGQLADGTTTNKTTPTQIGTSTTWSSISAGSNHTIAIKTDGTLWAWGNNSTGQLGDGTTTQGNSPVQIN